MAEETLFHKRPLCLAALGLMAGILVGEAFYDAPFGFFALIAVLLPLLIAGAACFLNKRACALLFLFLALGLFRAQLSFPQQFSPGSGTLSGVIAETPVSKNGEVRLILRDVAIDGTPVSGRAELTLQESGAAVPYGARLVADAAYRPIARDETYRRYQGLALAAASSGEDAVVMAAKADAYGLLLSLREALSNRIEALFPQNGGLARAMLLGDKNGMTESEKTALYDSGIGHLAAVSGLHVGILSSALGLLLPRGYRTLRLLFITLFLVFYSLITALSPSVLRAAIILFLSELALYAYQRFDLPSALGASAAAILLVCPPALYYAGFQLSFLAIFGLITLYPAISRRCSFLPSAVNKVFSGSIAVMLATLPPSALFFSRFTPLSLLANLLALPLAPVFLVPGAVALAASYVLLPLGKLIALVPNAALSTLNAIANTFAFGLVPIPPPSFPAYLLYLLALLLISPLCLLEPKKRRLPAVFCLLFALLCWGL